MPCQNKNHSNFKAAAMTHSASCPITAPKSARPVRNFILAAVALALAACGGGGTSGSSAVVAASLAATTPATVASALNLDFSALANYANPVLPAYYDASVAALDNTPAADPVNDKIATLGRVLFHDKSLSVNNTVSCSSCHLQTLGFDDDTRFSTGLLGLPIAAFTAEENRGRALFLNAPGAGGLGCAGCHQPPTFALAANSRSNGLDAGETTVFKSPSLKSAGLSSAFMHDGRFSTLAQVVEHYNSGVQAGPAVDNRLLLAPGGAPRLLNLPAADKAALAAFLLTLGDTSLVADARFASPFKN
jgi:cytochrome c peroxidase